MLHQCIIFFLLAVNALIMANLTVGVAVRCLNGSKKFSNCMEGPSTIQQRRECLESVKQRQKEAFVEIECGPEHTQCFNTRTECHEGGIIADAYKLIKGCALPGNASCQEIKRKECRRWERHAFFDCDYSKPIPQHTDSPHFSPPDSSPHTLTTTYHPIPVNQIAPVEIHVPSLEQCAQPNPDWLDEAIYRSNCKGLRVLLCYQSGLDPQSGAHDYKPSRRFQLARKRTKLTQCCECMQSHAQLQGSCKRASNVSNAPWHTLKMDQEMNRKQKPKFKEYNDGITIGAFLDDYFGLWALKMDISGKENGSRVWAKCGNGTSKGQNLTKNVLRCLNGSGIFGGCIQPDERARSECENKDKQQEKEAFVEIQCGPEHTQCIDAVCPIADAFHWIKGCALPADDATCQKIRQIQRKNCRCNEYPPKY